jgi:hypothetical protein
MSVPSMTLELPTSVTTDMLRTLQADATARAELLRQIIGHFEGKYQCSLEAFERKLENMEVPEHPGWEESIEWRNAVEQLERAEW